MKRVTLQIPGRVVSEVNIYVNAPLMNHVLYAETSTSRYGSWCVCKRVFGETYCIGTWTRHTVVGVYVNVSSVKGTTVQVPGRVITAVS